MAEDADQRIGEPRDRGVVRNAPPPVTLQGRGVAGPAPFAARLHDGLGQAGDVAHPEVESLARDRVQMVRGVADQHGPIGDDAPCAHELQRERRTLAGRGEAAEAAREHRVERLGEVPLRQPGKPARLVFVTAPHQTVVRPFHRQQGRRAAGREPLEGGARAGGARGHHRRDRALAVVAGRRTDAERFAQLRPAPVGHHQQEGGERERFVSGPADRPRRDPIGGDARIDDAPAGAMDRAASRRRIARRRLLGEGRGLPVRVALRPCIARGRSLLQGSGPPGPSGPSAGLPVGATPRHRIAQRRPEHVGRDDAPEMRDPAFGRLQPQRPEAARLRDVDRFDGGRPRADRLPHPE